MSAIDSDFYAAFAGRVRHQLATTRSTAPEGDAMNTETETVKAPAVPATFQAAPDAPCTVHTWCEETGTHMDHIGKSVAFQSAEGEPPILEAYLYTDDAGLPSLTWNPGYDSDDFTTGEQLRAQVARVRTHLVRLDAFADQYDAIREATAIHNAQASIAEHGATPEQAAAMAEITRIVTEAGNPIEQDKPQPVTRIVVEAPLPAGGMCRFALSNGSSVSLYRPAWAEGDDPSEDNLTPDELRMHLEDLHHARSYKALRVEAANLQQAKGRYRGQAAILCPQLDVRPYSDDLAERIPTVSVEISEGSDDWIENLDPAGVADLAAKLRAQAAVLDQAARDLTAARADWAANGGKAK